MFVRGMFVRGMFVRQYKFARAHTGHDGTERIDTRACSTGRPIGRGPGVTTIGLVVVGAAVAVAGGGVQ